MRHTFKYLANNVAVMRTQYLALGVLVAVSILALMLTCGCLEQGGDQPGTPAPSAGEQQTFSLQEVAEHNSSEDCWIAVHGKVYNVTTIPCHGGGAGSLILQRCGQDATALWESKPGSGEPHSENAQSLLDPYYIGELG